MREIGRRRAQIDSRQSRAAGRKDPWRGAVPEFEAPGFTPVQVRGKNTIAHAAAYLKANYRQVLLPLGDVDSRLADLGTLSDPLPATSFFRIWPGDRSTQLSVEFSPQAFSGYTITVYKTVLFGNSEYWAWDVGIQSNITGQTIVLPAGRGKCIVVALLRSVTSRLDYFEAGNVFPRWNPLTPPPFDKRSFYFMTQEIAEAFGKTTVPSAQTIIEVSNHAFLVHRSSAREIGIKGSLLNFATRVNPTQGQELQILSNPVGFKMESLARSFAFAWTPAIFETLNQVATSAGQEPPIPPSMIKIREQGAKFIATDTSKGFYSANGLQDLSFYYSLCRAEDACQPLPSATQEIPQNSQPLPSGTAYNAVWDWKDPAYCISMCKALGFTDEDLTP